MNCWCGSGGDDEEKEGEGGGGGDRGRKGRREEGRKGEIDVCMCRGAMRGKWEWGDEVGDDKEEKVH